MRLLCSILLVLSLFSNCQNESKTATTAVQKQDESTKPTHSAAETATKIIVFFGNSLTAAYGLEPEQGFPAAIQEKIKAENLNYTCVNAGLSGETTAGGLKRVDWILQQKIDVFVLELGGNDALRGLPVAESKKNLEQIIELVRQKNPQTKILLTGMQAPPNLGERYTREFREMYPAIAKNKQVALLPFLLEGVGGDPKLNQADGIHPTAEGQKIVAANIWKVLKPLL